MEILNGIRYVRPGGNFQPKMKLFCKIDVNGDREHPLFTFLKVLRKIKPIYDLCLHICIQKQEKCPPTRSQFASNSDLYYSPKRNSDIRWNFEKFLIDRQGRPVKRYDAGTKVDEIIPDIFALLN